ncbi:MAG: hypothetical protein IKP46_03365 [Bacteroidales bacterium]|nr:hypothetical protein [Bacteroidales bacterium]
MKRIVGIWPFLTALLVSAVLFSCTGTEEGSGDGPGGDPDPVGPGGQVVPGLVFSANLPEGCGIYWSAGDRICVNGAESEELSGDDISGRTARFKVSVEESASYSAVFPASAFDNETGDIVFPERQITVDGGFDPAALIFDGETSSRTVSLAPRYAGLELVVTPPGSNPNNLTISYIQVAPFDGNPIGGRNFLEIAAQGEDTKGGLDFGKTIGICIPSGEYPEGLRFTVFASDGSRMSFSKTGAFEAAPGEKYSISIPKYSPTLVSVTSLRAITSSSVALTWSGIDPAGNSTKDWTIHLYGDASCGTPLKSWPVRGAMSSGDDCGFSVGGLEPARDYWFKVEDVSESSFSEAIPVKMPAFTSVKLPTQVASEGVILAEDFSASVAGDDPFSGLPGVTEDVPEDFSGDLSGWEKAGAVGFHPGYLSIESAGRVLTPAVVIADGKNIIADVTLKVAGQPQDGWAVFVVDNPEGQPDTANPAKYRSITLSSEKQWEEITVSGLTIASGQRIAVGRAQGNRTLFFSEISVRATGISSIFATLLGTTSSTLSYTWTLGGDAADDAHAAFLVELYDDPSCSHAVQSFSLGAGACGTGSPRFVFSGLSPDSDYYLKVTDSGSGETSDIIQGRTEAFAVKQLPEIITRKGIALAEDFSELRWDADPLTRSAGFKPSNTGNFANGPGTFVPYGNASAYLLKQQSAALPGSRLEGWASDSDVYIHPGMLQLGRSGGKGWIFTPEFSIPSGGNATVNVTIHASTVSNTASGVWCIAVLDRTNANVTGYSADFNHHPNASDTQKIQFFTLNRTGEWQTLSAEGLSVEDGDRIMFGVKGSYTASGDNCRALVKDLTVEVTDVFAPEDPLVFAGGTAVTDADDWALRREEIKEIFQREMYGTIPSPKPVFIDRIDRGNTVINGVNAVREQYRMWFSEDRSGPKIDWLVVRPRSASGPVPVILTLNYWGNHTFIPDPEVVVPDCWMEKEPEYGISGNSANPDWRGKMLTGELRYHYPIDDFLRKGYAFVTACYAEVCPDPETVSKQREIAFTRVFDLWAPRDSSNPDNPMSLGVWGWSLMRAVDMIETLPALAADKIMVTGCSRLGKAALIAGAFDERIALVAPVQTGSGGVPMTKHITPDKETIASETSTYTHWFSPRYAAWAGREAEMPFDQHLLLSLVAPRPLLVLGFNNLWFDAYGEFLSLQAASPVWTFLGKDAAFGTAFPETGSTTAIGANLGYARRDGAHGVVAGDWDWILNFSERHLK